MRKRPLGKTGLVVSELALGTWGLSGDAYGPVAEPDAEIVLRRAVHMGITTFDTADAYGAGRMERLLGKLATEHPELVVVTKGGIDRTVEPPRRLFSADYLRSAVERSCKRLGKDALQVFLLHNPSPSAIDSGAAVYALEDLKREGKIEHWGVSAGNDEVARLAIDRGAEVVELAYNLTHPEDLHRISGDVMVSGCGVLARSVLAHGLLAGMWSNEREFIDGDHRAERWTREELEKRLHQLDAVRFLVKGDVHTMRAAAVRFALSHHLVSSVILGPRTRDQLEQLVRETGSGPRYLPDADLRALPRALDKVGIHC
jgi:aryl-alcohol dehydrogenase-like predicted oxidoreductase